MINMRSFEEYWEDVVPLIIESSEELAGRGLDQTQVRLHNLIMQVFSFAANTTIKLNKETQESMIPALKKIADELDQLNKLKDPDL
jgi:hypothetical protein